MAELTPGWRKSSNSVDNGNANCVEVGAVPWRKSSYSVNSGGANCVEAGSLPGQVLIRDTKDHPRPRPSRIRGNVARVYHRHPRPVGRGAEKAVR